MKKKLKIIKIGCELLKNFAMLGVATSEKGVIETTDPDIIEKSNLNRQFLFRKEHIHKPKSVTASQTILKMNSKIKVNALLDKVCNETENKFNDEFFSRFDLIVNALDNVEARRYMDERCVQNQKPLFDSGTLGTKGHTQVIIPFKTKSYNDFIDAPQEDYPQCTIHSFPSKIEVIKFLFPSCFFIYFLFYFLFILFFIIFYFYLFLYFFYFLFLYFYFFYYFFFYYFSIALSGQRKLLLTRNLQKEFQSSTKLWMKKDSKAN